MGLALRIKSGDKLKVGEAILHFNYDLNRSGFVVNIEAPRAVTIDHTRANSPHIMQQFLNELSALLKRYDAVIEVDNSKGEDEAGLAAAIGPSTAALPKRLDSRTCAAASEGLLPPKS